jgi:tetratricopeptide (TPR) repeat protein
MSKLSKQELKEPDIFQATVTKVAHYIEENKTRFYVFATAGIAAIVIAVGIYLYWSNYQTSAMQIYTKAQNNMLQSVYNPSVADDTMDIFKELIDKYPYSWSARMAHYHLGNIYYNMGELDNAIDSYKKFISSVKSDEAGVKFLALTSLGYCYESRKDFKSALEYFEKAQTTKNVGFESMGYRNIARIYEQLNDKEKALENYKTALEKNNDAAMELFIKRKISSLS